MNDTALVEFNPECQGHHDRTSYDIVKCEHCQEYSRKLRESLSTKERAQDANGKPETDH